MTKLVDQIQLQIFKKDWLKYFKAASKKSLPF